MWCPVCKAEYREGIFECAECRIPLVAEPPQGAAGAEDDGDAWGLAEEFADEIQAELAEGLLVENGIPCRLEDVSFHSAPVPVSEDMAQIRLWVKEEDLEEARAILAQAETESRCSACGAVVTRDDATCPECGETLESEEAG
jgi:rubrerythrin